LKATVSGLPALRVASRIAWHFSASTVIGFSVTTRQPASTAATMYRSCSASTVVTTTSVMRSLASISAKVSGAQVVAASLPEAIRSLLWYAIRVGLGSHSAATVYPARAARPRLNNCAREPVPMMATLRSSGMIIPLRSEPSGPQMRFGADRIVR
jgi:hypothetical protein